MHLRHSQWILLQRLRRNPPKRLRSLGPDPQM